MVDTMETEMDLSDGEQAKANAHVVALPQYSAPPVYNKTGLMPVYGNSSFGGVEASIERRQNLELPGYIFMCNGRTKVDCFRYRVFGTPRERIDIIESLKPGMKLFLYDFEKKLLYGVYEVTIGGKFDIEPEAFEGNLPAQVGFRIFKNCYPLPEHAFQSVILENYNGVKFKQELAPHQVTTLLSIFRPFAAPELDSLAQRLASRASAPSNLSFEERLIAATQLRNGSGLDPLAARHAKPQPGSLLPHRSVPNYIPPPREALSLSNLNQPYYPTESQQQRLSGDTARSSIQDPQLKYLTILSDIRRYGSASENEHHSQNPSEKGHYPSPYSENKYYSSTIPGNEHPSASAANGSVYTPASQKEGEASQQHKIPSETAGYPTPAQSEAVGNDPQPAATAVGNTHQTQSAAVNYTAHSQPGSVEESTQAYYAALGYSAQQYAGTTGYSQQPNETGYAQQPYATANAYAQQPHETEYAQQLASGYAQQSYAAASGYAPQTHAVATSYAQQPHAAATGYAQQPHAAATGYAQQPHAAATGYAQQPHAAATGYTQQPYDYTQQPYAAATEYVQQQPHPQAVGYTPQYHPQPVGYTQQAVTQSSTPGAPGTTDWNAAYQSYYPQTSDATTTYNQTS